MNDPYAPTQHASTPARSDAQWRRVLLAALIVPAASCAILAVFDRLQFAWLPGARLDEPHWPAIWTLICLLQFSARASIYAFLTMGLRGRLVPVLASWLLALFLEAGLMSLLDLSSLRGLISNPAYPALGLTAALAGWRMAVWRLQRGRLHPLPPTRDDVDRSATRE